MELKAMRTRVRSIIREPRENFVTDDELNDWINDQSFEATKDLNYPWQEQILHGIEEQADYDYASDFVRLHPLLDVFFNKKKLHKLGAKWLESQCPDYQTTDGVDQPSNYYTRFRDKLSLYPPPKLQAEGTATVGSATSTLVDSSADFSEDYIGHSIRNITDGSNGLITAVASTTSLTAVLTGGTSDVWAVNDTYKINRAGTVPYVYKETVMTDEDDKNESIIAAEFPYVIIYRVAVIAYLKANQAESAAMIQTRSKRYDDLYGIEFTRAKRQVNQQVRGYMGRTVAPELQRH
ncbi:hypothetical protein ES703_114411 [subsurface metagenome]